MAYTKVFPIRNRLYETLDYAQNPDKTVLENTLDYAMNKNQTETTCYESAFVCGLANPCADMMQTKARFGKAQKGVDGYHLIQSFKPGETTPEQAHEIGREFARRYLASDYEVVVTTHLDKSHLHNHFVFNSVAYTDGRKFRNNFDDYYRGIRAVSDEICKEQRLSVIEPAGKGRHYSEWKAEKEGKTTIRSLVRTDVDECIAAAISFPTFIEQLKKRGYAVKYGPHIKHMAIKPQFGQRPIRVGSLGEGYTEQAIQARIDGSYVESVAQPSMAPKKAPPAPAEKNRRYRLLSPLPKRNKKKLRGFVALYWKYCYLLKLANTRKLPSRAAFLLWDELRRLEQIQRQFFFVPERH